MVSCFNLPVSGNSLPYLFTICAVASVKCLYNWGRYFHWIVCLCLLNFWNPWYILKLNSLLIICVANIFVTCLYYTLLFFFFLMNRSSQFQCRLTDPSFHSQLALFPLFMLFSLSATYLGQETHRVQNLLWVLGTSLWIPIFTPSNSLRVYYNAHWSLPGDCF